MAVTLRVHQFILAASSHQCHYFGSWSEENTRIFVWVRIRIRISRPYMQIWIRKNRAVPTGSGSVKLSSSLSLCQNLTPSMGFLYVFPC
jgi:hypothetical protein